MPVGPCPAVRDLLNLAGRIDRSDELHPVRPWRQFIFEGM